MNHLYVASCTAETCCSRTPALPLPTKKTHMRSNRSKAPASKILDVKEDRGDEGSCKLEAHWQWRDRGDDRKGKGTDAGGTWTPTGSGDAGEAEGRG